MTLTGRIEDFWWNVVIEKLDPEDVVELVRLIEEDPDFFVDTIRELYRDYV